MKDSSISKIAQNIEDALRPLENLCTAVELLPQPIPSGHSAWRAQLVAALESHKSHTSQILHTLHHVSDVVQRFEHALKRRQRQLEEALAPVSTLPPEVLGLIFLLGRDQARDETLFLRYVSWIQRQHTCNAIASDLYNRIGASLKYRHVGDRRRLDIALYGIESTSWTVISPIPSKPIYNVQDLAR